MKKLLLIPIFLMIFSCSKDDSDDCGCFFYPKMNEYANCHFENGSWKNSLENAYYPEDIERIRQVALRAFKCE